MRDDKKLDDEDHETVSLCKAGDSDAFESFVIKYQKNMLNIAYRMVGNYDDACEVVQDAFVSAYKNLMNFQEKAKFSTWLYTIVVNLSRNRLKQMKIHYLREELTQNDPVSAGEGNITMEFASSDPNALEQLESKETRRIVEGCIERLDSEFREVFVLRDMQGFSYDEISDMLKIAGGTVKSRLFRAREAVRDCLKKSLGDL